jgi:hypothetical protein
MAAAFSMGIFILNPHVCVDFELIRLILQQILLIMRILCISGIDEIKSLRSRGFILQIDSA